MKNYTVYFESFGKKMKTTILAESEQDAKKEVLNKIVFHKIELKKEDEFNQCVDMMDKFNEFLKTL